MHIYFSGIGGAGLGPLALIAHQAGFTVSGSDQRHSSYIDYLQEHGVTNVHIGQNYDEIAAVHAREPIDWFVYTSALPMEHPDAPELKFCVDQHIKHSKRDAFLSFLLEQKRLKLLAVAGTHGKTTTTAMLIWLLKQLGVPVSYSVGGKLSFGDMGEFEPASEYFVYEADEFDRNFLAFHPYVALITGVAWDHPDIYPTQEAYNDAFRQFLAQSERRIMWRADQRRLGLADSPETTVLDETAPAVGAQVTLPGHVNRLDAWQVAHLVQQLTGTPLEMLVPHLNAFPGVSRRFEQLAPHLYSDYAHTPEKIQGALQLAHEVAGNNVVVIYEGLHNTRQHFIKDQLAHLFDSVKRLYIVPSYLAREDPNLPLLTPTDLRRLLSAGTQAKAEAAALGDQLAASIKQHIDQGDLVLALSAGGGGSLDEWLRKTFTPLPAKS